MLETQVVLHSNRALVSVGKAKEKTSNEIECKATKTEKNVRERKLERERNCTTSYLEMSFVLGSNSGFGTKVNFRRREV
jgi:hypothetical protein